MHSARVSCRLALTTFLALTPGAASAQTSRDPTAAAIGFGGAAAIAGEQIVIGRPGTLIGFPIPPSHAGTVHIFVRSGDRWMEQGMVRAKDGVLGDGFGTAIATDGNLMAVGAPGATGGGAVYVFERGSGGRWVERARLSAAGGADGDRLGASIALRGGVLLVGAPGRESERGAVAVYARGKGAGEWKPRGLVQAKAAAGGDWFGAALAFDGQRALIGAPGNWVGDSTGRRQGQAFVFRSTSGGWSEEARLQPPTEDRHGSLGVAVLLNDSEALVGAPRTDSMRASWRGIVVRGPRGPRPAPSLQTDLRPAGFGTTLARDGGDLLIGAPNANMSAGGVYVFRRQGSGWTQVQLLVYPARRLLHPSGRRDRCQRRDGRGRRAARGFLRGHWPALSSGRGWWKLARGRRGD